MPIENALKGVGVKWIKKQYTYKVGKMRSLIKEALTSGEKGLKVIIAEGRMPDRETAARKTDRGQASEIRQARRAHALRRRRGHLHGRSFLYPPLGLPVPVGET